DLGCRARRFRRPSGGLADVDDTDCPRAGLLVRDLAQQPLFLRAADEHVARHGITERVDVLLAHRRMQAQACHACRPRERIAIERYRAVARAKCEVLVGEGHNRSMTGGRSAESACGSAADWMDACGENAGVSTAVASGLVPSVSDGASLFGPF